ncbi:RICIN domain-containing protein [Streptomyces sp. NPDC001594]|uniref:RICIN domain-containing protein n=1 Tax=Streptomyces sp. NPDC001594 TaxID=3364590 RepID=UPI003679429D
MTEVVNDDDEFKRDVVAGICGALGGTGARSGMGARMERSSSTNVLLAVMLNGFARHAAGQPLSDLEGVFTNAFSRAGFTADELGEMGQAFSAAAPEVRGSLFPGRFAALGVEDSYGLADLRADLPQLGRDFLATCSNIRAVDATRPTGPLGDDPDAGAVQEAAVPEPSAAFLQETADKGWGLVCMGLPLDHPTAATARSGGAGKYWVSLDYLTCHRESNEWGKDEPKFSLALCDGDTQRNYTSEKFSMNTGDTRAFEPNRLWNTAVANGGLAVVVDAWEMDHGGGDAKAKMIIDEVLKILMAELSIETWLDMVDTVIGELTGVGVPPAVVAMFAMILTFIRQILTNQDDHIGTYSLLVPEPVLMLQKQIQDTLRNPPPEGVVRKIAALTRTSEPIVEIFLRLGAYRTSKRALIFDSGSDGKWEIGFLLLPDASNQLTGLLPRVRLESVLSGKFATIHGPYNDDSPSIRQEGWYNASHQRWELNSLAGDLYKFTSVFAPTRVMSIHGPYPGNAPDINLWTWRDASHQKWHLLPVAQNEYFIVSDYRGGAISVTNASTNDGAKLCHHGLQGNPNQLWRLLGA